MSHKRLWIVLAAVAVIAAACGDSTTEPAAATDDATVVTDGSPDAVADTTQAPATGTDQAPAADQAPVRTSVAGIDLTRHVVPLEEVIFDTFDGNSVALTDASEEQITRLLDAIAPIDNPTYENDPIWLTDEDLVLTYVDSTGQAWAWPHRILNFHEIVNDEIGGTPILVSFCPLCRSGVIYDRRLQTADGETLLSFGNSSALYENDLVMVDRETNTYWWQVRGLGIVGTLSGTELTPLAAETTRWPTWIAAHPDTLVLTRESGGRLYENDPFGSYSDFIDTGRFPFPVSEAAANDDRLAASALVIIVTVGDTTFALDTSGPERDVDVADVTVHLDGVGGAKVLAGDGSPFPSRSAFWFSAVSAFPDLVLVDQ